MEQFLLRCGIGNKRIIIQHRYVEAHTATSISFTILGLSERVPQGVCMISKGRENLLIIEFAHFNFTRCLDGH